MEDYNDELSSSAIAEGVVWFRHLQEVLPF